MTPQEKVISIAQQELGYLEKASNAQLDSKTANAGYNNWTKYARDLDNMGVYNGPKNSYAWCAVFVFWTMVQAFGLDSALKITGQKLKGNGASCTSLVGYYKAIGQFFKSDPRPGDQIFFSNDGGKSMNHTGLVVKVTKTNITTIEGNTSSAAGVVANGGAVREKTYALNYSKIGGYGRPKYELIKQEETKKEEDDIVTQVQFNQMMDAYIQNLATQPVSWEKDAMDWAVANGIIKGDEQGQTMSKKFLTRGEMATILQRFEQMLKK